MLHILKIIITLNRNFVIDNFLTNILDFSRAKILNLVMDRRWTPK